MKKKSSIRSIILGLTLGILIPVNLLTFTIYGFLYSHIKSVVAETQRNAVEIFLTQFENQMNQIEKYILRIINDENWGTLNGEIGETTYELTKVKLQKACLDGNGKGILNYADAICGYIYSTEERLSVYNDVNMSESEKEQLRQWTSDGKLHGWTFREDKNRAYFCLKYGTGDFCLAAYVTADTVIGPWQEQNKDISLILSAEGKSVEKEGYVTMQVPIENMGAEAIVFISDEYIQSLMPTQYFLLMMSISLGILLILLLALFLQKSVVEPLKSIEDTIVNIREGHKESRIRDCGTTTELQAIETEFNSLMDSIYHLEIKNYQMEIENQKAQLMNLQLQINPHLLLNTLNTIYGLAEIEDYSSIQRFTMNLVQYFRYSLKRTDELVTLKQEQEFVKCYGNVQSIRYPNSFYIMYDVDDSLLEEKIPPLIIQNFVENSIKYAGRAKTTEILVIVRREEDYLMMSICDDGKGIPEEILKTIREGKPYMRKGFICFIRKIWNFLLHPVKMKGHRSG